MKLSRGLWWGVWLMPSSALATIVYIRPLSDQQISSHFSVQLGRYRKYIRLPLIVACYTGSLKPEFVE